MKALALALAALILTGCGATSGIQQASMVGTGTLHWEPVDDQPYDFRFQVNNVVDLTYNMDRRADRVAMVESILADECASTEIATERVINRGKVLGREQRTYVMDVRCLEA